MARRWLLTVLTGTALSLGLAGTASAQELVSEPVTVDAEVVEVTVSADTAERTLEAEIATDLTGDPPGATAEIGPEGASLDTSGPVDAGTGPVEDAADPGRSAAGDDVAPAPSPAIAGPAPVATTAGPAERTSTLHSRILTADGAAARTGGLASAPTYTYDEVSVLAPEVAPPGDVLPVLAAATPTLANDLALPIIDTTPTVPALLRLLAGLLVVGAAATWQTVRSELA